MAAGLESAIDSIPAQGTSDEKPGFSAMVVDDHPLVRESMVARLKMMGAREVVEAATIGEARARANLSGPRELCVLDLGLPDGSGLDLLADLRSAGWQRLVVLSAADDPYSVRAGGTHSIHPRPRAARLTGAEALSGREVEVLQLVSDGRSNKEIGEALGLSALTVKSHLARIARKLGTGDRAEMVVVAMRAGVVV